MRTTIKIATSDINIKITVPILKVININKRFKKNHR
jgi:hypothetical protein